MPVVTIPRSPLEYWIWRPGDAMTRGFWNIPVPAEKVPVDPDVVIAPLVGFSGCWRLGYGGGYFDRTLAARAPRPIALGVGFDFSDLPDFAPEPHDIPMETIVTDKRIKSRWQI
jgi:5,10-methenyltetrahydrofolate synthetase